MSERRKPEIEEQGSSRTSSPTGAATPDGAATAVEYAYWRQVEGEQRPARALGAWAEVWARVGSRQGGQLP